RCQRLRDAGGDDRYRRSVRVRLDRRCGERENAGPQRRHLAHARRSAAQTVRLVEGPLRQHGTRRASAGSAQTSLTRSALVAAAAAAATAAAATTATVWGH